MQKFCFLTIWLFLSGLATAKEVALPSSSLKKADEKPKFYLITIGINHYSDSFWHDLKWAELDATRISGDFGEKTGLVKVNFPLAGAKATKKNVEEVLQNITRLSTVNDIVALYISTHGTLAPGKEGELERIAVLRDTTEKDPYATGLRQETLRKWLNGLRSRKKVIILATCHSGFGKSRLPTEVKEMLQRTKGTVKSALADVSEGALILTAASQNETAQESDELRGDVYTHFLLEALKSGDRNQDGIVSALEAHDYAAERTFVYSKEKQRPTIEARIIGDPEIPLLGKRKNPGLPMLFAYDRGLSGFSLSVGNREKGDLPRGFVLDGGNSQVVKIFAPRQKHPLAVYRVKADEGERIELSDLLAGHPFVLGAGYNYTFWQGEKITQLLGKTAANPLLFTKYRHRSGMFLGLSGTVGKNHSSVIRQNLTATFQESSYGLDAGYLFVHPLSISYGGAFCLWRETMTLKLTDTVNEESLDFSSTRNMFGFKITGDLPVWSPIFLDFSLSHFWVTHEFGVAGSLYSPRTVVALGLSWKFGGKGEVSWFNK